MICAACRDQDKLGLDPRPRFGGVFELRETNSSADKYWGERWELYKVQRSCLHATQSLASRGFSVSDSRERVYRCLPCGW